MARDRSRFEIERAWIRWTSYDYLKANLIGTTWGKAMIVWIASLFSTAASWLGFHSPLLIAGSLGGFLFSFGIFLWAWLQSRNETYTKPLVPDALAAIDQRIDIVWKQIYRSPNAKLDLETAEHFKNELKRRIRLMLVSLSLVKTQQEYAVEEIAKITNDKDHPFNHPEDSFHEMALRRMIELKEMAYLRKENSN